MKAMVSPCGPVTVRVVCVATGLTEAVFVVSFAVQTGAALYATGNLNRNVPRTKTPVPANCSAVGWVSFAVEI